MNSFNSIWYRGMQLHKCILKYKQFNYYEVCSLSWAVLSRKLDLYLTRHNYLLISSFMQFKYVVKK